MGRLLAAEGLTKAYGRNAALDGVSFAIDAGEVVGIVGENGAGKSTLVSILGGALAPDAGRLTWKGRPVRFRSPRDASSLGIGVVHQHDSHVPRFTAAENLGLAEGLDRFPDASLLAARLRELAARYGLDPGDPEEPVERLSVGARQRLEILKALCRPTELLLLDEPTAVLTPAEVAELLEVVRSLRDAGVAIVLVDHKLAEVLEACSRVVVLRQGRVVQELPAAGASPREVAAAMVGHAPEAAPPPAPPRGETALEVVDLTAPARPGRRALGPLSFTVKAGEIVGIAGVDGNGQEELLEALTGLDPRATGIVRASSVGAVPLDRRRQGLVLDFSVEENLILDGALLDAAAPRGWLAPARVRARALDAIARHRIAASGPGSKARELSGGNQQKILTARALAKDPAVLVAGQPTRGLDVDAAAAALRELRDFAARGGAVVLISTELDELARTCHRIHAISRGRLTRAFPVPLDPPALGELAAAMAGVLP
jgi:simple sugar transport system ATP-binding protein